MNKQNKKVKPKFGKIIIPIVMMAVILYTIAAFCLQFYNGTEISPSLTVAYFAFWTGEVFAMSQITKTKVNNNYSNETNSPNNNSL